MKTTAAFSALTAHRIARGNKGGFALRAVTKSGALSKVVFKDYTGHIEFDQEQAEVIKCRLENLNPGKFWSVVAA
jgi:hypothetical protein